MDYIIANIRLQYASIAHIFCKQQRSKISKRRNRSVSYAIIAFFFHALTH